MLIQFAMLMVQLYFYHKNTKKVELYRNNVSAASRYREIAEAILQSTSLDELEALNTSITQFYDMYKPLIELQTVKELTRHLDIIAEQQACKIISPQFK
jgi:hypothetical protein